MRGGRTIRTPKTRAAILRALEQGWSGRYFFVAAPDSEEPRCPDCRT
jgi:hypothetical protein